MLHTAAEQSALTQAALSLKLPTYALDGRPIRWNRDRSAAVFRSTADEYHSDRTAVSSSMLRELARSPAHLQAYLHQSQSKNTIARIFGTAVHSAVLETHLFRHEYVVFPGEARRGQAWEDFKSQHPGKTILRPSEMLRVVGAARAVLGMTIAEVDDKPYRFADIVRASEVEINYYWIDKATGLTCKARMDCVASNAIFDVKTTDDSRQESFMWQAAKQGYDIQSAFYLRGLCAFNEDAKGCGKFYFVAVEDQAPHVPMLHEADQSEFVKFGDKKVNKLLAMYKKCQQEGQWPAYEKETRRLKLPLRSRYPSGQMDI